LTEAINHPHIAARGVFVEHEGHIQPAPAPRFSRTEATLTTGPSRPGGDTKAALEAWGITDVDALIASGAAAQQ
jgi:alpha-methylacyl-CoA racemase